METANGLIDIANKAANLSIVGIMVLIIACGIYYNLTVNKSHNTMLTSILTAINALIRDNEEARKLREKELELARERRERFSEKYQSVLSEITKNTQDIKEKITNLRINNNG